MFVTESQKTEVVKSLLLGLIKDEILNEFTLKQNIQMLVAQVTAKKTPSRFGIGIGSSRFHDPIGLSGFKDSEGFYNLKKHLSDMVRAGINPELDQVGLNQDGMIVAVFKTKSSEHILAKGPEDKEYQQKLVFTDWPTIASNPQLTFQQKVTMMIKGNIEMKCGCLSDNFHYGYARHSKQADVNLEPHDRQATPAPVRNPEQFGIGCKHLALIFLPQKVQKVWGPKLMKEIADMLEKAKKNQKPAQIDTKDVPFGPPPQKEREPIAKEPDRQPVIEPPKQGPLQKTKYGDKKLLSKDDPRFGKPGFQGPSPKAYPGGPQNLNRDDLKLVSTPINTFRLRRGSK